MSKSKLKTLEVAASIDGKTVPASITLATPQSAYIMRGAVIEPVLGLRIRAQGLAMRSSALEFGRLVLAASQIDEIVSFGLVAWLRYWGDSNASKSTVSNCLRLARSATACENAALPILGDRESRQLASDCKAAELPLQDATPAMIRAAIVTTKSKSDEAKVKARANTAKPVEAKPVGDSEPNASADASDFVKHWKSEAVAFILTAGQAQLLHIMQVCSTLLTTADGRLTADSRKSTIDPTK